MRKVFLLTNNLLSYPQSSFLSPIFFLIPNLLSYPQSPAPTFLQAFWVVYLLSKEPILMPEFQHYISPPWILLNEYVQLLYHKILALRLHLPEVKLGKWIKPLMWASKINLECPNLSWGVDKTGS